MLQKSVICALQHPEDPLPRGLFSVVSATHGPWNSNLFLNYVYSFYFLYGCFAYVCMYVLRACESEKRGLNGMELE